MISIEGDHLTAPIEITDPAILDQFNIWNGAGVSTRGPDGIPDPPAYLDPNRSAGRFIDWPRGMAAAKPSGLQRLEVAFHIGFPGEPKTTRKYMVAYEIDASNSGGYIFLPRWTNDLIWHGVEGNWFYASERWNEVVMPIVAKHSDYPAASVERGELECKAGEGRVGTDGTIEFFLLDEHGNRTSRWRYETSNPRYQSVKAHIGDVEPGQEFELSCWPARS